MSHNFLKIANSTPNLNSEISLSLSNLSNVSNVSNNEALQYDSTSSGWTTGKPNATNKELYYAWHKGNASDYGTGLDYANSDKFAWITNTTFDFTQYKDSSVTVNKVGSYARSLTFSTSGTYLFLASCSIGYFDGQDGNESMDIQWSDGTPFGSKNTVFAGYQKGSVIWGIKTITSSTEFFINLSNCQSDPNGAESEQATAISINIYKI